MNFRQSVFFLAVPATRPNHRCGLSRLLSDAGDCLTKNAAKLFHAPTMQANCECVREFASHQTANASSSQQQACQILIEGRLSSVRIALPIAWCSFRKRSTMHLACRLSLHLPLKCARRLHWQLRHGWHKSPKAAYQPRKSALASTALTKCSKTALAAIDRLGGGFSRGVFETCCPLMVPAMMVVLRLKVTLKNCFMGTVSTQAIVELIYTPYVRALTPHTPHASWRSWRNWLDACANCVIY